MCVFFLRVCYSVPRHVTCPQCQNVLILSWFSRRSCRGWGHLFVLGAGGTYHEGEGLVAEGGAFFGRQLMTARGCSFQDEAKICR